MVKNIYTIKSFSDETLVRQENIIMWDKIDKVEYDPEKVNYCMVLNSKFKINNTATECPVNIDLKKYRNTYGDKVLMYSYIDNDKGIELKVGTPNTIVFYDARKKLDIKMNGNIQLKIIISDIELLINNYKNYIDREIKLYDFSEKVIRKRFSEKLEKIVKKYYEDEGYPYMMDRISDMEEELRQDISLKDYGIRIVSMTNFKLVPEEGFLYDLDEYKRKKEEEKRKQREEQERLKAIAKKEEENKNKEKSNKEDDNKAEGQKTKTCPYCNTSIDAKFLFCPVCGKILK